MTHDEMRMKTSLWNMDVKQFNTKAKILEGNFDDILQKAPLTDLNIFGISETMVCESMRKIVKSVNTSCLFVKDSGDESALV